MSSASVPSPGRNRRSRAVRSRWSTKDCPAAGERSRSAFADRTEEPPEAAVVPRHGVAQAMEADMPTASRQQQVQVGVPRSEEHTSELPSLMRSSYAVFCLKKKKTH